MATVIFAKYGIKARVYPVPSHDEHPYHYLLVETGRKYRTEKGAIRGARAYIRLQYRKYRKSHGIKRYARKTNKYKRKNKSV